MSAVLVAGLLSWVLSPVDTPSQKYPEGYLAVPPSKHGRGVLVLHPWWGLNGDVKAFCDRLAKSGFIAFAPDLFHGKTAKTESEAEALVKSYRPKEGEINREISEAAKYLAERSGEEGIGVVGFSFGAYYALSFSNAEPKRVHSVVVFYGTGQEDFGKSKASYLGHFAENDDFEPKSSVDSLTASLKAAGRPSTIYTYPATGHWFFEPSVTKAYGEKAAELAWQRTLEFLQKTLTTAQ
ncbi:dienelactone hydrolase family protein [bacterium]|nr:MAG: dienelactone hydrolase family protein [bacterium]